MYVAFSHQLTKSQIDDAEKSLGVTHFYYEEHLKSLISNMPTEMKPEEIRLTAEVIVLAARTSSCDYLFIAGQSELVHYALEKVSSLRREGRTELIAVNSLTERQSVETEINGVVTKTSIFKHVRWREII
jgi:hypothetical protein